MTTLTTNPNLTAWGGNTIYLEDWTQEDTVKKVAIEKPTGWKYRYQNDYVGQHPNRVPQSLHVDNEGFKISAGYFQWYAGYAQTVTGLEAGKRYLLKVLYRNTLADTDDPTAVGCHGIIFGHTPVYGDFQYNAAAALSGSQLTYLYPFEMTASGDIEIAFMTHNMWGEGSADVLISYIGLEPVADDYGGDDVIQVTPIGGSSSDTSDGDDTPDDDSTDDDDTPTGDTDTEDSSFITLSLTIHLTGETETAFASFFQALAGWVDRQ